MKKTYLWAIGVFILLFGVYCATAARLPVNYADSDDLTLAAFSFSLAHPPGYPLLVLLLHPLLRLSTPATVVLLATIGNAFFQAMAGSIFFLCVLRLVSMTKVRLSETTGYVLAFFSSLLWCLGWFSWSHGTLLEVFALAHVLFAWYMWLVFSAAMKPSKKLWLLVGLLGGVLIFYHQLFLLVVAPTILFFGYGSRKQFWRLIGGSVAGLSLAALSYVPFLQKTPSYGWSILPTISGVWQFFSRQILAMEGSAVETYVHEFNLRHSFQSLFFLGTFLVYELTIVGVVALVLGIVCILKLRQKVGYWLVVLWLVSGPILVSYMKFPIEGVASEIEFFWGTSLRLRMLFIFVAVSYLIMTMGVLWLFSRFRKPVFGIVMLLVVLAIRTGYLYPAVDLHESSFSHEFSRGVLSSLPPEAMLIVDSDMVFGFLAEQILYDIRPDIDIVPASIVVEPDKWKQLHGASFGWDDREEHTMAHLVSVYTLLGRRVFLYNPDASLLALLGSQGDPFFAAPYGYTFEISRSMPPLTFDYDYHLSSNMAALTPGRFDWWVRGQRAHLAGIHAQLSYYYARLGYDSAALAQADLAARLYEWQQSRDAVTKSVVTATADFTQNGTYSAYLPFDYETYLGLGFQAHGNGETNSVQYFLTRALLLNPLRSEAWEMLGITHR